MEQLDIKDIKIKQLEEEIKRLKEENVNLKKIIMWQSYDKAGVKLTYKNKEGSSQRWFFFYIFNVKF